MDLVGISQNADFGLAITELPEVLITNELPESESLGRLWGSSFQK